MSIGATSTSSILPSDDGMAKVADLFVSIAGKELNSEALRTILFLQQNGSSDLALEVLRMKMYQASPNDLSKFIDKLSPAQHAKDMMAAQAEQMASRMKGV